MVRSKSCKRRRTSAPRLVLIAHLPKKPSQKAEGSMDSNEKNTAEMTVTKTDTDKTLQDQNHDHEKISSSNQDSHSPRLKLSKGRSSRRFSFKQRRSVGASLSTSLHDSMHNVAGNIRTLVSSSGNIPDYERLKSIEGRRRKILKRKDLSFFKTLLFYDGTVLQTVLNEPMLWITMLIYILVRVGAYASLPTFVSEIGSTDTTTVGAFLTFFLVFFTNNAVNRFDELYHVSMACSANIFNAATLASSSFPRERGLRLVRYLNAAHVAGYVGLSETYNYDNFFLPLNESKRFLTKQELERIELIDMDAGGGSAYREIVAWCMEEVNDAVTKGIISEMIAWESRQFIQNLRNELNTMFNYDDQPIHFFITHFTVLMTVIFLPLVAVSQALDAGTGDNTHWIKDVIQGIVVLLQAIVLLGLRALSVMLCDP